nr:MULTISPECIES: hypothetical protein [Corallococcus]
MNDRSPTYARVGELERGSWVIDGNPESLLHSHRTAIRELPGVIDLIPL